MVVFHHVNLGVPTDGADAEGDFLVDLLGMTRVPLPPEAPSVALWFEAEDGKQVHLSVDPDHAPAARAHVAVDLGADLAAVKAKLTDRGYKVDSFNGDDLGLAFCRDPAGNLWELRGAPDPTDDAKPIPAGRKR
jgi:catechol 2,3-dioxygenase-like lactoylglutathione lyase family enzyme